MTNLKMDQVFSLIPLAPKLEAELQSICTTIPDSRLKRGAVRQWPSVAFSPLGFEVSLNSNIDVRSEVSFNISCLTVTCRSCQFLFAYQQRQHR